MGVPPYKEIAASVRRRAQAIESSLNGFPNWFERMETLRVGMRDEVGWPDWCLVPMAAAEAATMRGVRTPSSIAEVAAIHAYRFSRSIYIFEPCLADRIVNGVPDPIGLEQVQALPDWCPAITVAGRGPDPDVMWAHLEHDALNGRPELRLLFAETRPDGTLSKTAVPVYLDRDTTIGAVADMQATTLYSELGQTGADVRGGPMDGDSAFVAAKIDGWAALVAYLARPEADIRSALRDGRTPVKPLAPKRDEDVWLVGYQDLL